VNAVQIALGLIAAALIGALGWMTDWGQDFTAEPTIARVKAVAKADASVLPDFKLSSDSNAYAVIAERPLLNPTRKPAPTQPIPVAAPEPPKPQIRRGLYQLIGVTDLGEAKIAQVREVSTNKVRSIKPGDTLQELSVKSVSVNQVVLAFQGDTDVLELAKFTASGRVPQPAPSVQPPPIVAQAPAVPPPPGSPPQQPSVPPVPNLAQVGIPNPQQPGVVSQPPVANQPVPGRSNMRERLGIGRNRAPDGSPAPQ
jgi:hypothetical protein